MKTFTNYAAKAKQFLNLLQGYTKGIRLTAILILLLMGVSNVWGKTIYLYTDGIGWPDSSAKIWVHAWGSGKDTDVQMTKVKEKLYQADIPDADTKVIFTRTQSTSTGVWDKEWDRVGEQTLNDETPCLKLTGWSTGTWGKISYDAHMYLDNSVANWTEATKEFMIGHSSYSDTYTMTQISNTKLYYLAFSNIWHGYWDYGFIGVTSHWGPYENQNITTRIKSAAKRTGTRGDQVLNGTKLFVPANANNDAVLTKTDLNSYSDLNSQQTIKSAVNGADANSKAPISITSYAMTAHKTTTEQTATLGTGANVSYITAARTATTTLEVGTIEAGYQFDGWYTAATGGTQLSKKKTYTYYPTAATTVYARFSTIKYTVIYGVHSSGNGTLAAKVGSTSISSGNEVNYGSKVVFTASPSTGYEIEGWYSNADCTTSLNNGTDKTYTIESLTAEATVYVKFKRKQHTVNFGVHSSGNGTLTAIVGNTSIDFGDKVNYGSTIVFTATPSTGYQIEGWYSNSACTTPIDNGTNNTYTVTIKGGTNVYVKFVAQQYTITYKDQNNANFSGTHASGYPTTHTYGTATTLSKATKTGYTFGGWHTDAACTNKVTSLGATEYTANITLYAKWTANQYTITYKDQNDAAFSGTHASGYPTTHTYGTATTLKTASKTGYTFEGWHTDESCTNKVTSLGATEYTANITLYAKWIPYGDCVFFKNNLNWDEVYVYFYSSDKYWTDDKGTGANMDSRFPMDSDHRPHYRKFRGKMTRIGLTDIWYFDYISAAKRIDPTNWEQIKDHTDNADNDINYSNIAFTAHEQYDHSFFDNTKVIRRGDFKPDMQLFIPQTDQTPTYLNKHDGVSAKYYNKGLWLKYNSTESGYNWSSNVGNWDNSKNYFTSEIAGGYSFTAEVELNAGSTYDFKIHNQNGTWFGKNGTMTQDNCTNWWFKEEVNDNAKIKPTVNGTYIFTAYLGDGKVIISLDYPLSTGDYRLAYLDKTANSFHPGHYIKKRNTSKNDTVSFFIHYDNEPQVIAQCCTAIDNNGNATWETITDLVNPAASITETGVYNFTLQQIEGQNDPQLLNQARPYTGNYYIRTDAAPGGWKSFRQEGNKMTYSSYAATHEDFDHYFCEWVSQEKGLKNVKYTVANDYSYCISDTLSEDIDSNHPTIVTDKNGDLPSQNGNLINANVRWGWDSKTNKIRRAYIAGSGHKKDRFLVLEGNSSLLDVNGKRFTGNTAEGQDRYNLTDDEVVFDDMGNWIYQMDVKANKDTKIDLTAKYNNLVQYFKGGSKDEDEILLIVTTNDNEKYYKIRIIYDFKTNHLISAWLPEDETITTDEQLGADMMIIRHNQEKAEQLNFNPLSSSLTKVGTAYAVMTFDKYFLNNKDKTGNELAEKKSENERKFYWISFPFDVKLSEVFGFGEYGDQWIMEYYDGEARAKEGYWAETETFWKYITNKNYVLKAGQGYVLCLNLNKMGFTSTVFAHTTEVSLYFPSTGPLNTITGELPAAVDVPAHTCTIERDNRNIYDSHWNLIGVPGFANIEDVGIGEHLYKTNPLVQDSVSFYYEYIPATNKYHTQTQTETFQTMYSYMIQYTGTINWRTPAFSDPALMARRIGELPDQYTLRLVLHSGDKEEDQTFVQLQEERATSDFDMNLDLAKMMNSGANIYTLTANTAIMVAGNALPMEKATVPVGVRVDAAGEYTFRMPDGTDGIAVTLVDNATGTHTNMLMSEYTVTLNAGTIENRFYLVVDPDRTATSVENIGEGAKGDKAKDVEKFLIDGKLFIRTTDGIFDAKGQRL